MKPGWRTATFDEAVEDVSGGNVKTPLGAYRDNGALPIVDQGEGLIGGYSDEVDAVFRAALPVVIFGDHTRRLKFVDFPFGIGADGVKVLRPRIGVDAKYLYRYLQSISIPAGGYDRHFKYLKRISIDLPALPEQRRIAEILDRSETLRTQRRQALAPLDALAESIFLEMFGDPASDGRAWRRSPLADLGTVRTGGTPPSSKSGMFGGDIPFVTPGDLESGESAKRTVTVHGANQAATVRAGAALVCCIGATIGKMAKAQSFSAFNQQINAVEWGADVDDDYGIAMLRFFKADIARWGASTTLPILKKSSFAKIAVPVPPIELQRSFSWRAESISTLRLAHLAALVELDSLFASLQHRAFRGEL